MPQTSLPYTNPAHDGRVKFTPAIKKKILAIYRKNKTYRGTARLVKELLDITIDKKMIKIWTDPTFAKLFAKQNKQRQADYRLEKRYNNAPARKLVMRKYRAKKRKLGFLIIKQTI